MDVKAFVPTQHVLILWLGVGKDILPVLLLPQIVFVSVKFHGDLKTVAKLR